MLRIFSRQNDRLALVEAHAAAGADIVWVDLENPTPEEDRQVEALLGISVPTRAEMEEIEPSARLYTEAGSEFMTVTALARLDTDAPTKTPITFILKGRSLVTVRYIETKPFGSFIQRAQKPDMVPCASGEQIMLGILEAMIDRTADALERVGNGIDEISHEVFRRKQMKANRKTRDLESVIARIGDKAELVTILQESLVSTSRLVAYHSATAKKDTVNGKDSRQIAKLIQRDAVSLAEHARALTTRVNFLLDATLGLINLEQNQIIKIFSVAAVVFLPPTLVASIYGMNFEVMPELGWHFGYPWALALMVVSAIVPYLYFKRRGWL
jgi:magnesium transporter